MPGPIIPILRNDVPILNEPLTVRSWFPTVLANCGCDSKHALLLQGVGAVATCPRCQRSFTIVGMAQTPTGDIGVQVAQVVPNASRNGSRPA